VVAVDNTPLPRFAKEEKGWFGFHKEPSRNYSVKLPAGKHELIVFLNSFSETGVPMLLVFSGQSNHIGRCEVLLEPEHQYIVQRTAGCIPDKTEAEVVDAESKKVVASCPQMRKASSIYRNRALKDFLQQKK